MGLKVCSQVRWSAGGVFVFCFFLCVFVLTSKFLITSTVVFQISLPNVASPCWFQRVHDCTLAEFDVWLIQFFAVC